MTEDDTFRILSRPGTDEMFRMYWDWNSSRHALGTLEQIDEFLSKYKWTREELSRKFLNDGR